MLKEKHLFKISFLLLLFCCFSIDSIAQSENIDALKKEAFTTMKNKKYDKARSLFQQIITENPGDARLLGMSYNSLGAIDLKEGFNSRAIDYFEKTLAVYESFGNDTLIAISLYNNGRTYKLLAHYEKATELLIRSIKVFEKNNMKVELSKAYNILGNLYRESNSLESALKYNNYALEIALDLPDSILISKYLNNRGSTYLEMEFFNEAADDFKKALAIKKRKGSKTSIANTYYNLGESEFLRGNLKKSRQYFLLALNIHKQENNRREKAYCFNYLGHIQARLNDWRESSYYLKAANLIADSLQLDDLLKSNYNFQRDLHERRGDLKKVIKFYDLFVKQNDKVLNSEKQKALKELEIKYEAEKHENKILLLTKDNRIKTLEIAQQEKSTALWKSRALIIGVLLLIILVFAFQAYRLFKKEKEQVLKEKELNAMEKRFTTEQHHRIKNNLQALSGILSFQQRKLENIVAKEVLQESKNRVTVMTLLHETFYKNETNTGSQIRFDQYLRKLVDNLILVFDKQEIQLELDLQSVLLETDIVLPLGLISNEIITNAFKYGTNKGSKSILAIHISKEANRLKLEIKDNGSGIQEEGSNSSIGLDLINNLVKQMNGKLDMNNTNGTSYSIFIQT